MATTIYTYLYNDDLNGSRIVSMDDCICKLYDIKREIVLAIVKQFLKFFPEITLSELKAAFRRDYLGRFAQYGFIQEDIESAKNWKKLDHNHYLINDVLTSGDGVNFVICVEWDRTNIIKVLGIAQGFGMDI